jgi:Transcriptional Coactivator p15 (PC4)
MFLRQLEDVERSVDILNCQEPVHYHKHIGGGYYVSISKNFMFINIRRYFLPVNAKKEQPTRCGIALTLNQWDTLLVKVRELQELLPELKTIIPCHDTVDNAGYLNCKECNPFRQYVYSV